MAVTIKLKNASGSNPSASDLVVGEVAIRTDNGKLFTKKDNGTVAEISGGGGGIDDGDKGDITVSNSGDTFTIDNGVISTAKIADDAITNAKLATNSVSQAKMLNDSVGTNEIVDDAVTAAKLANPIALPDDHKISFGTGSGDNLEIFHESSSNTNEIIAVDGAIHIQADDFMLISDDTGGRAIHLDNSGGHLELGFDGNHCVEINGSQTEFIKDVKFDGATAGRDILFDRSANQLEFADDAAATFGTDDDLKITHSGSNGNISNFTGDLIIKTSGSSADDIFIDSKDDVNIRVHDTDDAITCVGDGAVTLFHNNSAKLATSSGGISVTGAIAVSSTVDGRDLATDGTKLDGIESGATADQTASEILTAIKTVDGASSGLDADTLDGVEGSNYAQKTGATCTGDFTFQGGAGAVSISGNSDIRFASGDWTGNAVKIQHHGNYLYIAGGSSGIIFREDTTDRWIIDSNGHLDPAADSTYDIGASGTRVRNIYADSLYGAGSNITGLDASELDSGTVNTARLPNTYTKAAAVTIQATGSGNDVKLDAADHIFLESGEEEDGNIYFRGNGGTDSYRFAKSGQGTIEGFLSFESLTADRTFTFPNSTGTLALTSDIPTNNNQLTNGAGYVTSNTQLSNEQVQDIVGGMVSGNSESGITVTYQDSDGTLDFSVSSSGISEDTGSWTPTVTFGGGSSGQSYSIRVGRYVKLGSLVHIQCHVEFSDKGNSSGTAKIAGLPFTIRNGTNDFPSAVMAFKDHGSSSSGPGSISSFMVFGDPNNTTLDIAREQLNDSTSEMNDATNGNFADNTQFMLTMTYVAA